MTVAKEQATANYVPAAAVIRRWQALSGIIGPEYFVDSLLCPPMIGLIRSLELVREEIVLKVIRRDIVIRFNSLTFAWIAFSGFRSTGKPFFSQVAPSGFQLAGCTDFFIYP